MTQRMNWRGWLTRIAVACGLTSSLVIGPAALPVRAQSAEAVIAWNGVLDTAYAVPGALPPTVFFSRPYAILNLAIFETLNSFDLRYLPYHVRINPPEGASPEAALAQAAHDLLVEMLPSQTAAFDAALANALADIPAQAAADGAAVGATIAREVLELRRLDGWSAPPPFFELPSLPGYWQPAPPATAPAAFTHYPDVVAFGLGGSQMFLPEAPPVLTSERYARDVNEIKRIGGTASTERTEEQTLIARLVAGIGTPDGPHRLWPAVLRSLARERGLSALDSARAYTLLWMATHDGLRTTFNGKYYYGLWRPVTAIREAARDGNPATEPDPTWTSLVPTPPYPSYPGNVACIGVAAATVLTHVFGRDDVPFSMHWQAPEGPGTVRSFAGFTHLADLVSDARKWGGLHFEFDQTAAKGVCRQVGQYIVDNQLRARF